VCGLSFCTEQYTLLCVASLTLLNWKICFIVVCLSVLNCTNYCVWCVFHYWTLHIAVCFLSLCIELNKMLCVVFLSVPNCKNFFMWLYLCTELNKLLCVVCLYWILHIAVCCLSVGTELFTLLCAIFLSVLNWKHCCEWPLLLLKCTHFCVRLIFR